MPIPTTFETFEVLGTTDEVTACDCCGKHPLKSTVALSFDEADPVFFGSTCAAKAAKIAPGVMAKAVRSADKVKADAARAEREKAARAESESWFAFLRETTGEAEVRAGIEHFGSFGAARKAWKATL